MRLNELFFQLIRIVLNRQDRLSTLPSEDEWTACYDLSIKQALVGICFVGVKKLPPEQKPPRPLYLKWLSKATRIQQRNELINATAVKVCEALDANGFANTILKGQGVAQLYDDELVVFRQSGDIDAWVKPKKASNKKESRKIITDFAKKYNPKCRVLYHQVDLNLKNDVELELHYTPSWSNSPLRNHRLQQWFEKNAETMMNNSINLKNGGFINAPNQDFNIVFILQHIYRHLFGEGIGLRQIMDYYFVLMNWSGDKENIRKQLQQLGLLNFAKSLMWVMNKVYDLPENRMICKPNEKMGQFLLDEIMIAGNFGQYDKRIKRKGNSPFRLFWRRSTRNLRFIWYYPEEVICTPIFKIWHYFSRKFNLL